GRACLAPDVGGGVGTHHAVAGVACAGIVVVAVEVAVAAVGLDLADASLGGVAEYHDAEVGIRRTVEQLASGAAAAGAHGADRAGVGAAVLAFVRREVGALRRCGTVVTSIGRARAAVVAVAVHEAAPFDDRVRARV